MMQRQTLGHLHWDELGDASVTRPGRLSKGTPTPVASLLLNGLNRSEGVYPTSKVGAPSVAKRRVERHARSIPRATFKQGDPLPATPAAKRRVERHARGQSRARHSNKATRCPRHPLR